jgi:demethylmenaquinone methyltransferase/2-methoxy-6-polyprenyl-1,4-benzoquinol methylase
VGEQRSFVPHLFDAIAGRYDAMNWLMTAGLWGVWHAAFRRQAPVARGVRVLDVGCGTGELARLLLRMTGPAGHVTGVDLSAGMLAVARRKLARFGDRVTLVEGDALALPFADASFDVAASAFVLRNVADPDRMLAEMARVVRPGGHVVTMELSHPPAPWVRRLFWAYFRRVPAWLGGRPYAWLPASLQAFPPAEELARRFCAAGLAEVRFVRLTAGIVCIHLGRRPGLPPSVRLY